MQEYYGRDGFKYVEWAANYALSLDLGVVWIMCQQGEGAGTPPPAQIINTCNGFYCDNWIAGHAKAFPNQVNLIVAHCIS